MSGFKDKDQINTLRERLYQRGNAPDATPKHSLKDHPVEGIRRDFPHSRKQTPKRTETGRKESPTAVSTASSTATPMRPTSQTVTPPTQPPNNVAPPSSPSSMAPKKKKKYRYHILLVGVVFFVLAVAVSSLVLIFGNNSISAQNIAIAVTSQDGSFAIAGGSDLDLQVGITNDNTVPIESATLIVKYPSGSKSAAEGGKDLFTERLPLQSIGTGETINVPLRAIVYGQENTQKEVDISMEYRVRGSNATFVKQADPYQFKITSSPVSISAETLKKISAGQQTKVTFKITSNSPTPLPQVLVRSEYPLGFDYASSDPQPSSGNNQWLIQDLQPQESKTITIQGDVVGKDSDMNAINFSVGVPSERDNQTMSSVFASTSAEFQIEQPFLDINLKLNGSTQKEVSVPPGDRTRASIDVTNTLSDSIYDATIQVQFSGNAFSVYDVNPSSGYYDSSNNTVTWDVSNTPQLQQLDPGQTVGLAFSVEPANNISNTPQLNLDVNAHARRVSESDVAEQLVGTVSRVVKVNSQPTMQVQVGHNNGVFTDTGPIPPHVGQASTYAVSLKVRNGSNDVGSAVVTATLPSYVDYLSNTSGAGDFTYNATSHVLEWDIGKIQANGARFGSFQVSFTPRVTQVGQTPALIGQQQIQANDLFTGATVHGTNPSVTTQLTAGANTGAQSGVVQQ